MIQIQWSLWKTSLPLSFGICPKWGAAHLCQAPHSPQGKQQWLPGSSFCSSHKALGKRRQHLSFSLKQSKQWAQHVYAGMYASVYMPALFLETLTVGKWENKYLTVQVISAGAHYPSANTVQPGSFANDRLRSNKWSFLQYTLLFLNLFFFYYVVKFWSKSL